MSFPKYEHYKDSGVEWLGEVPAHWKPMPIRRAARLESGHTPSRSRPDWWENCTVPWVTLADVWQIREAGIDVIDDTKEKVSELGLANSSARVLPKGTVILSRTASVGFSAIMGSDMATTQDFANWVCGKELLPEFLLQVFRAMKGEFRRLMMGSTHNTIYMPDIQAFRFVLPSLQEQKLIVMFLSQETTKLDALITEQRTLIDLLKEKRQAVISHAVTKGLDPRVPMKDSGVEWLGEVPAHWSVGAIGYKATVDSGSTPDRGNPDYWNGEIPWIKTGEINYVPIVEAEESITAAGLAGSSARLAKPGTLLMAMYGQGATRGRVAVLEISAAYNQACAAISFASDMRVHFAKYFFMAAYGYIRDDGNETSQMNLGTGVIRKMKITIPPISEQGDIVSKLDKEIELLENLTAEAESTIALLQERRSALISAAVTGKIDVRQAA